MSLSIHWRFYGTQGNVSMTAMFHGGWSKKTPFLLFIQQLARAVQLDRSKHNKHLSSCGLLVKCVGATDMNGVRFPDIPAGIRAPPDVVWSSMPVFRTGHRGLNPRRHFFLFARGQSNQVGRQNYCLQAYSYSSGSLPLVHDAQSSD